MRRSPVILTLLAVAAGAAAWFGLHRPDATHASGPAAPDPVPVVEAPVKAADVPVVLNGIGTVRAFNAATIRSQVTGVVQSVDFTEGQTVKAGERLAQIDPRPYQARLDQAQATLERDQAHLANAKVNLDRSLPLLGRGFATEQAVADQKAQVAQLEATVKFDQGALDDARTQLGYTTLVAPFSGITGVRMLDIGNVIHPSDANGLVVITQVQPISVLFTLPAATIDQVQDAMATGPLEVVAYDQGGRTVLDTGTLLLINNEANADTGTVQLKATFPNPRRRLWPGMFVNAELVTAVLKGALTIPTDALQESDRGTFVYVVAADRTVSVRPVTVGQRTRGTAVVTKGLTGGETVVVQGQYRLVPGATVRATEPDQVADSSPASAGMLP